MFYECKRVTYINKIYNEDCLTFMKKLNMLGISVDVIVTSPPYNINKNYESYSDNKKREEYLNWIDDIATRSYCILKDNGSFFLNISGMPTDPTMPFEIANNFLKAGYKLQNTIHWIKSISFEKDDIGKNNGISAKDDYSIGHFKPIVSERFLTALQEYIFHFTKSGMVKLDKLGVGVSYQDKTNIGRWKAAKQDKRDRGNVWFIPYPTIHEGRAHPAVFPEKLPFLCIKLHGIKQNMLVYDPFMGIGSTALACLSLGVNYIGTEIDKQYVEMALESTTKQNKEAPNSIPG
jgi:site-specific DNA-methyltransferase (adenine-specific)